MFREEIFRLDEVIFDRSKKLENRFEKNLEIDVSFVGLTSFHSH